MSQQNQNQPQYQGQQPPIVPPPGWTPPKPPKKPFYKRTWFIVVASIVGLIVLVSIIPSNGDSDSASTTDDTTTSAPTAPASQPKASANPTTKEPATTQAPTATQPPADTQCTGNRNDPCPVKLGTAFTVGKHKMEKGWKLQTEEYLGTKIVGTITNVSDDASMAYFHVKFLKGNQVLANFQCASTGDLEAKQTEDIECVNMSDTQKSLKKGSYDKITAEADF
jgi:hypothetical protein